MVRTHYCIGRAGENEFLALKPNYQAKEPEAVLDMANNLSVVNEKGDYLKFTKKADAKAFLTLIEGMKERLGKDILAMKDKYSGVYVNSKIWKVVEVKTTFKYVD